MLHIQLVSFKAHHGISHFQRVAWIETKTYNFHGLCIIKPSALCCQKGYYFNDRYPVKSLHIHVIMKKVRNAVEVPNKGHF